jgi:hypothetical protein
MVACNGGKRGLDEMEEELPFTASADTGRTKKKIKAANRWGPATRPKKSMLIAGKDLLALLRGRRGPDPKALVLPDSFLTQEEVEDICKTLGHNIPGLFTFFLNPDFTRDS